jgi:hypothetical protein
MMSLSGKRLCATRTAYWLAMTVLLLLVADEALAQERPQTLPTRDVDVVYPITRGTQTLDEHTRWRAAEQAERVDPPGLDVHVIINHQKRVAWLVNDQLHTVVDMALPHGNPLDPSSQATFTRQNDATIAGQSCTDWAVNGAGPQTVLCLTGDGVLLRVQAGGHILVEASHVTYAPSDPALFTIPTQYTHTAPPPPNPG